MISSYSGRSDVLYDNDASFELVNVIRYIRHVFTYVNLGCPVYVQIRMKYLMQLL